MFKTTRETMRDSYNEIVSIGYCEADGLLHYQNAIAYSTGASSWICDYYIVDGVLISTGYCPIADKNTTVDRKLLKRYNEKAWEITRNRGTTHEESKKRVNELLSEFVAKCIK